MIYDLKLTFADGLPSAGLSAAGTFYPLNTGAFGPAPTAQTINSLDLSTLQNYQSGVALGNPTAFGNNSQANVQPQWPLGEQIGGVGLLTPGVQLRNLGAGSPFYLFVRVRNGLTAAGVQQKIVNAATGTLQVNVWNADDAINSSNGSTILSSATFGNSVTIVGGTNLIAIALPIASLRRYLGISIVVGTAAPTTVTAAIDAFMTNDPTAWQSYGQPVLN